MARCAVCGMAGPTGGSRKYQEQQQKSVFSDTQIETCTYYQSLASLGLHLGGQEGEEEEEDLSSLDSICFVCADYVDQLELLRLKVRELEETILDLFTRRNSSTNDGDSYETHTTTPANTEGDTGRSTNTSSRRNMGERRENDVGDNSQGEGDGTVKQEAEVDGEGGMGQGGGVSMMDVADIKTEEDVAAELFGCLVTAEPQVPAMRYNCDVCKKSLSSARHLLRHKKVHDRAPVVKEPPESKLVSCDICKLKLKTNRLLAKHLFSIHSVVVPFSCQICQIEFKSESDYSDHNRNHHSRPVSCHHCGKTFLAKGYLDTHIEQFHSSKDFQEICEICSKLCKSKGNLKMHMRTHFSVKSFQCNLCEKSFKWESSLNSHIQANHNPVGPAFKCDVCSRGFKDRNNLKKHRFTHSNVKPFECEGCMKGFIRKDFYTRHKAVCRVEK